MMFLKTGLMLSSTGVVAKARHLAAADYPLFRRRLGEHLKRRGFNYAAINEAVEKVWREREHKSD